MPRTKSVDAEAERALWERRKQVEEVCASMVERVPVECLAFEDSSQRTALAYLASSALESVCLAVIERLDGH